VLCDTVHWNVKLYVHMWWSPNTVVVVAAPVVRHSVQSAKNVPYVASYPADCL